MPLSYRELVLSDFSGGITDKYINSPANQLRIADNMFITENGSLKSRYGSKVFFEQDSLTRIMGMYNLNDRLFAFRGQQLYLHNEGLGTLSSLDLPQPVAPFFQQSGEDVYLSGTKWKDQLILTNTGNATTGELTRPMKAFFDDAGVAKGLEPGVRKFLKEAIAPNFTGDGGVTYEWGGPANAAQVNSYVWAFHYSYEYKVGNVTHQADGQTYYTDNLFTNGEVGPTFTAPSVGKFYVEFSNVTQPDSINSQLDAANMTIKFYRTVNGGTEFFLVRELPSGTTLFTDNESDSVIINNEPLYTNSGVLESYQPPKCKYMTIVNDIAYYAYVEDDDSNEVKPYRIIQGNAGTTDACHPSAYKEFDDKLTGISNVNGFPIVFTDSYIYRLEGSYDITGGGNIRSKVISEKVGCIGHNSIMRTNNSLFFIGNNGVYATDGYKVERVPATITMFDTIQEFIATQARRDKITAAYDYINDRIIWSVSTNDAENNKWLILNLKTMSFTTASGKSFFSSSVLFKDNSILRSDDKGYIYDHKQGYYSDVLRDITIPKEEWETTHIPFNIETVAVDFGSPAVTKWVSKLNSSIKSATNYAVLLTSNNDDERIVGDLKFIRSFGTFYWGDPSFVWGDPDIKWKKQETESHKRHFPRGSLRCKRKQVRITPADVIVYRSDVYGTALAAYVDPANPIDMQLTLENGNPFPDDSAGYYIQFDDDGYVNKYLINNNTNGTILISGGATLPGAAKNWQITGKYKNQEIELKSLTITYASLANEGTEFKSSDSGGNA